MIADEYDWRQEANTKTIFTLLLMRYYSVKVCKSNIDMHTSMAFPAGLKPALYRLGGDCVIQLRYGNIFKNILYQFYTNFEYWDRFYGVTNIQK